VVKPFPDELADRIGYQLDSDRGQQQARDTGHQLDAGLAEHPPDHAREPQRQPQHDQHAGQPERDSDPLGGRTRLAHEHHDRRDRPGPSQQRRPQRHEGDVDLPLAGQPLDLAPPVKGDHQ
jgi:hypothetical protein